MRRTVCSAPRPAAAGPGSEASPGAAAGPAQSPGDDLDQAWARFEAEQELEALRRRQSGSEQG